MLAAIGLASLVLVPWLTIKHQLVEAVLIGVNLFAVARFTRVLSPVMPAQTLERHRAAWTKIRAANNSAETG